MESVASCFIVVNGRESECEFGLSDGDIWPSLIKGPGKDFTPNQGHNVILVFHIVAVAMIHRWKDRYR